MNQTEYYLKAATQGLWGAKKRELRTELEGHINERIQEFRLGGLSAEEAERQTLRELGTPERVSGGMLGVHTVPAVGKAGAVSFLLATALLTAVPQGLAQVRGIYTSTENGWSSVYLDFEQFKAEIEKAGGKISGPPEKTQFTLPDASKTTLSFDTTTWPDSTLVREGKTYTRADLLLTGLGGAGVDGRVSGWKNPTLHIGESSIQIQTDDWQVASDLYTMTVQADWWNTLQMPLFAAGATDLDGKFSLKGQFENDKIYALTIPKLGYWTMVNSKGKAEDGNLTLITSASQAQAESIEFHVPNGVKDFKLYSNLKEFKAALEPYQNIAAAPVLQWDAAHPAPVLVLELSGHFGPDAYKVVPPSSIQQP